MQHCWNDTSECNSTHCRTNSVPDFWSTGKPSRTSRGVLKCEPTAKRNNTATCLFAADILPRQKAEEKEKKESSYKCVLNLLRETTETFFSTMGSYQASSGDLHLTILHVCPCVCMRLPCVESANKNKSGRFSRSANVRGTLPTALQKWSTSMDNLDSPPHLLAEG